MMNSFSYINIQPGQKIQDIEWQWTLGVSRSRRYLSDAPSWSPHTKIEAMVGDIHVHCFEHKKSGKRVYRTWIQCYEGNEAYWEIATQGMQHPRIDSCRLLLSQIDPENPRWVQKEVYGKHKRRVIEARRARKGVPGYIPELESRPHRVRDGHASVMNQSRAAFTLLAFIVCIISFLLIRTPRD
ncbi:hypothetical protein FRC02_000968 [Tulasnella sp. 418]|nr:hypothetical protein FRC02_000968 [Tulasnella sp. 418]